MSLSYLEIGSLRNIKAAQLSPGEGINLIVGPNGSGKTSLLESIYLMGRGRSFRVAQSKRIVANGSKSLYVFGRVRQDGREHNVGITIDSGAFKAKIDGVFLKKSSELASLLPLLFISPSADRLVSGSPRQRRRFIDLGLFHVEHSFLSVWQRYNRILLQRNAVLRTGDRLGIRTWDNQLAQAGKSLHEARLGYVRELAEYATGYLERLLPIEGLKFSYQQGWPKDRELLDALVDQHDSDFKSGFTQRGPHRADLRINVAGQGAAQFLSGGQQKMVASALILAQAALYRSKLNKSCVMLVDDLPSELDPPRRKAFIDLLKDLAGQTFITATDIASIDMGEDEGYRVFHVEHGVLGES